MKNFLRAVRLALTLRWNVVGIVGCSFLVAALWGANIGTLYPIFEVSFARKSLQQWAAEKYETAVAKADKLRDQQLALQQGRAAESPGNGAGQPDAGDLATELRLLRTDEQVERLKADRIRWLSERVLVHLPSDPFQTVMMMIGIVMLGTIIKDLLIVANSVLLARLTNLTTVRLQEQFFSHTMQMDMATFGRQGTSGWMSHMGGDVSGISRGLLSLFGATIREPLKMVSCLVGASVISWRLLAVTLILAPLAGLLIRLLAGSIKRAARRSLEIGLELNRVIFEAFNGLQTVQAYTMEDREVQRFRDKAREAYDRGMKIVFYNALSSPLTEVLGIGAVCIGLASGAYLVLNQQVELFGIRMTNEPLTWPSLLVFYGFLIGMSDPARKLSDVLAGIQIGAAAANRLYPILDEASRVRSPVSPQPLNANNRELDFSQIHFHYHEGQPVLRGVSLTIAEGERLAIVGPNGCGKSTLVGLIPRFYDPCQGSVKLGGVDLRDADLRELRQQVGVVSQTATLFDDTVMNNIRYGRPDASDEEVLEAARRAHAHEFITRDLPHGYQTRVGQGGGRLSGGQRQRVILARVILKSPPILVLDEATSQIDPESEHWIHVALEDFTRGRTVLMVTHRASTLDLADRVIVMNQGRIEDEGRPEEIFSRSRFYQNLTQAGLRESA